MLMCSGLIRCVMLNKKKNKKKVMNGESKFKIKRK